MRLIEGFKDYKILDLNKGHVVIAIPTRIPNPKNSKKWANFLNNEWNNVKDILISNFCTKSTIILAIFILNSPDVFPSINELENIKPIYKTTNSHMINLKNFFIIILLDCDIW